MGSNTHLHLAGGLARREIHRDLPVTARRTNPPEHGSRCLVTHWRKAMMRDKLLRSSRITWRSGTRLRFTSRAIALQGRRRWSWAAVEVRPADFETKLGVLLHPVSSITSLADGTSWGGNGRKASPLAELKSVPTVYESCHDGSRHGGA